MAKCKVCGAPHRACGPRTTVIPIDTNVTRSPEGGAMSLKPYEVVTEGRHPHTTTLMLSDEDAKRMGVLGSDSKATTTKPAPKRAASKKAAPKTTTTKARTPRNKAAQPAADKTPQAPAAVEAASDPDASE